MRPGALLFLAVGLLAVLLLITTQEPPLPEDAPIEVLSIPASPPPAPLATPPPDGAALPMEPLDVSIRVDLEELGASLPEWLWIYEASNDPNAEGLGEKAVGMHENLAAHREVSGASGGVFLADVDRLWRTSPETLDVERTGNANAAVAEAEELMRAIEVPGESLTAPTVTTDWMDVADSTGAVTRLARGYNVTYRRIVQRLPPAGPGDRLPTAGPGGRIRIFLDAGANVVGLLRVIRKLTPIEEQPVIPLDEVIRRFREDPLERITLGGVRSVDVHGIALAYLEWGINDHQEIVPPVYVFDCVAHGNGWEVPYVHYLEAVDCPLGPIWASE